MARRALSSFSQARGDYVFIIYTYAVVIQRLYIIQRGGDRYIYQECMV